MPTLDALRPSTPDVANFTSASRQNETWVPVTKFKHGKWKVKWTKYRRPWNGEQDDDDQQVNSEYGYNDH
jgi:hypothetical protein